MPSSAASLPERDHARPGPPEGRPPLVVICGATATGKSALAISLCESIGGLEIVSADSRQVYRGMDIGTDKVALGTRLRVPHHCLDLVEPDEPFSVADFVAAAHDALSGIAARGRAALLVGGTGLYLRAVARGLPIAQTGRDDVARRSLEARLRDGGLASLIAELRRVAPSTAAATDLANPRRVIRALERVAVHGDSPPPPAVGYRAPVAWLGLALEPTEHRTRIDARAARQFSGGLPEEAARLLRRYRAEARAFSAFGYREAFGILSGELTREQAVAATTARTWAYARRQRTWFRAEPGITWLDVSRADVNAAAASVVGSFLTMADA
ncbi:tRNA (adenosine(37)-N6)-dimethylallyltransferase MiaA [soil metagenome]